MPPLSYDNSIRVLLEGICGVNTLKLGREINLSNRSIRNFLSNNVNSREDTRDKLASFVWKKMNSHLLIGPEDKI